MTKNLPASVHSRLLNKARADGRPFNELLQYYAMERFLYRLSLSRFADLFVLKGALLLRVWEAPMGRPTLDVDLLGRTQNDVRSVTEKIREVLRVPVESDGLEFDIGSVEGSEIAEKAEYRWVRVTLRAYLGTARIKAQIDIGFGDPVHPGAKREPFPTLLESPPPVLLCYSRESVVAEKLEAMVRHGEINTRIKDFYDVWLLASSFEFDGPSLKEAIRQTFNVRQSVIELPLIGLSEPFTTVKAGLWRAFINRSKLDHAPETLSEVTKDIRAFVEPVLASIMDREAFESRWAPRGPWTSSLPTT